MIDQVLVCEQFRYRVGKLVAYRTEDAGERATKFCGRIVLHNVCKEKDLVGVKHWCGEHLLTCWQLSVYDAKHCGSADLASP